MNWMERKEWKEGMDMDGMDQWNAHDHTSRPSLPNSVCTPHGGFLTTRAVYLATTTSTTAATQARERLLADNAKKAQIADLQSFVSRFSANALQVHRPLLPWAD